MKKLLSKWRKEKKWYPKTTKEIRIIENGKEKWIKVDGRSGC